MRRVLSNLKPSEFEDIVAVNALYRPDQWKIFRFIYQVNIQKASFLFTQ
ncbi:hypothetical protein KHA80_16325 [Anaerobacillus sp. HL2]|nr:hypothetical protein KHA80_16325 [Anaerobacillus sp. HL2]